MKNFHKGLNGYADYPAVVADARKAMGLSDDNADFAHDILKVEVFGPEQPQLTLVDLPGLIQSSTDAQKRDQVEIVGKIVTDYMRNPRSIILAIVSATDHYVNQGILDTARDIDRKGERTLGIITKPDALIPHSDRERLFLELARNEPIKLKLGWHVVRNTDMDNPNEAGRTSIEERQKREDAFFQKTVFKADPSVELDVGTPNLRIRLSKLLFEQVRDSIYPLLKEIEHGIRRCQSELDKLGEERSTAESQRKFLGKLSARFHQLCRDGIRGDYGDDFFRDSESPSTQLCAVLRNSHDHFAQELKMNGARWRTAQGSEHDQEVRHRALETALHVLKKHRGREVRSALALHHIRLSRG